MKIVKPQKLGLLTRCFEQRRRHFLSVGILALHRFSTALSSEAEMWRFLAAELGNDAVPDAAMPKSRAEFLVTGRACQPEGIPRPACRVRVRLGRLDKALYVVGDRERLPSGDATEPEPFVEMPITWERAFGGKGFDWNPLGKGVAAIASEQRFTHPLPNIELAGQIIDPSRRREQPAGFGPIDVTWPQRFRKAGTHDDAWLREEFPGFAADMDWSIFNIAPDDQHQSEPFQGDEPFTIEGMHPQKPRLEGRLPGIRTRCFVTQRTAEGEAFIEMATRLTTVWLFPHAERYLLMFHGSHAIADDEAADVSDVMIAAETLQAPRPVSHYRDVLKRRRDPDKGALHALRDDELLPATAEMTSGKDAETAEMEAALATEGLLRKHQRVFVDREIEKSRAFVASLGLDPDLHAIRPLPPDEPAPDLDHLGDLSERLSADLDRANQELERRLAEREDTAREMLLAEGLDADAILAASRRPHRGPPTFSAEQELLKLRELSAELHAEGCPVEHLDHYATDPTHRQLLTDAERAEREGYRQTAHRQEAAPRFSGEEAARSRLAAVATLQSQGSLARQNLTGFDLSDLDLRGVDLSGAWLENATLARANLEGANLSEAVLARADLTEANLTAANLTKANLGLAHLTGTRLVGAVLSEAILHMARLERASLRGVTLDGADFTEADFSETDMSDAALPATMFLKTDLKGVRLRGADLKQCTFIEADVSGVDFTGAHLDEATFVKTTGDEAVFTEARLVNARFVQDCVFERADFRRAILDGANLRGTRLAGSDFSEARLSRADLSTCDLRGARLDRALARDTLFAKSRLASATLAAADLMNASLQKADLSRADLRGANLFQADLARASADHATRFENANTKKARVYPRRSA